MTPNRIFCISNELNCIISDVNELNCIISDVSLAGRDGSAVCSGENERRRVC